MKDLWHLLSEWVVGLLDYLYHATGSLGVAIILLTLLVKILIYPLTSKQLRSMKEMQKLQPQLKKLQEKHKEDPRELQRRMFALYKEKGVNPLGGCFPLLVQMPILILVYHAIIGLKNRFAVQGMLWGQNVGRVDFFFPETAFLWIPTLLAPDMILLLLYALSMYVTQRLTVVPTGNPQQDQTQKMMAIMMPLMLTVIFRPFPSAFILYWFVFNILTTAQQFVVMPELRGRLSSKKGTAAPAASPGAKRAGEAPSAPLSSDGQKPVADKQRAAKKVKR